MSQKCSKYEWNSSWERKWRVHTKGEELGRKVEGVPSSTTWMFVASPVTITTCLKHLHEYWNLTISDALPISLGMEYCFIIFSKIGPEVQAMHLNANIITNFICTVYIFEGKFLGTILSRIYSNL